MRILGLDPGSRHTGYGCIDQEGSRGQLVGQGRFSCQGKAPLPGRLHQMCADLTEVVHRWSPEVAVLETPFRGVNARSLIVLAQARGALLVTLSQLTVPIAELTPAEVKSTVTGNGRADKEQVARMVRLLLRLDEQALTPDAADALAIALSYAARRPLARAVARQGTLSGG